MNKQPLYITKIVKRIGYLVVLEFSNGERRFIDFKQYLQKHKTQQNKILLESEKAFAKIKLNETTVYWPNTARKIDEFIDYYNPDPEVIYKESKPLTLEYTQEFYKLLRKYSTKIKEKYQRKQPDLISFSKTVSALF